MKAAVGDEIIITGHVVGESRRVGQVVEVRGTDGAPPYLVCWDDSGRTTLLYPGYDATIKPLALSHGGVAEGGES